MIELPDSTNPFFYENGFYMTCDNSRIAKLLAHYELFKKVADISGDIVEFGVFKGTSLIRLATFAHLFSPGKKIIGFDTFGEFPETRVVEDQKLRENFIQTAGAESIGTEQLASIFHHKKIHNVELVAGDITRTLPEYLKKNPHFKASIIHIDVDIYEPTVAILNLLYPNLVTGGILILDDYGVFFGETKAVDEYFSGKAKIKKLPWSHVPSYIIKE